MDGFDMKIVNKPWGKEEWLELNDSYCYKRIYLNAGHRTSLQLHERKVETNYVISGKAEVWLEDDYGVLQKTIMQEGDYFNVKPPRKHRVVALTDVILQEVSTPEVDDVIRVEDDSNRPDGRIEVEHQSPAVLILCAGLGTRMHDVCKTMSKVLLPLNNKAILSHIIEKFPHDWELVIALGYKGDAIQAYCKLAHSDRNIKFVYVDDYTSPSAGPGYSALQCKQHLQKPFYFITGDAIIDDEIPSLTKNWLSVYPTAFPEKYATVEVTENQITKLKNKSSSGFSHAFSGIAGIYEYETFWKCLENNIKDGEIVSAFYDINAYSCIEAKHLNWFDTGNVDDFLKAKSYFKDAPLSLLKDTGDCVYHLNGKFIKFFSDRKKLENIKARWKHIQHLTPTDVVFRNNFLSYSWVDGENLYEVDDVTVFEKFLSVLEEQIQDTSKLKKFDAISFYIDKTHERMKAFANKHGEHYYSKSFEVNKKILPSMKSILYSIDFEVLFNNPASKNFHGDLQFANILYQKESEKFFYIDWRDSFGKNTEQGDVYYDLAKLMGGMIISYDNMKNNNDFFVYENGTEIQYSYDVPSSLELCRTIYKRWLSEKNYDCNRISLIVGLIFLNMAPLHDDKFSKLLWFKSMEMLHDYQTNH